MNYFVTAIDTDSGKTIVSAILCEALLADYWKPVQAGLPRDADTVKALVTNNRTTIHPEQFILKTAASPHAAAKIDGVVIRPEDFRLPATQNNIIIEGAGGCLVPINDNDFVVDLIPRLNAEVILVADLYLGSINHTLLTIEALRKRNLSIKGIIFNGKPNPESERIILRHSNLDVLLNVAKEDHMDAAVIRKYAVTLKQQWK